MSASAAKSASQSTTKSASQSTTKSASQSTTKSASQSTTKSASQSTTPEADLVNAEAPKPNAEAPKPNAEAPKPNAEAQKPKSPAPVNKGHLYKILVIGDLGSGKTSIIQRYVHRSFTRSYRATIGVDFTLKILKYDETTRVRLQLWDIAGQERFGNMTRVYYRDAVAAFVVFDVTRPPTFDSVANWKADLDAKVQLPNGDPLPCMLLANKCDQPKDGAMMDESRMAAYCEKNGFAAWYETSAKENINVDEAARALVGKVLENAPLYASMALDYDDRFSISQHGDAETEPKSRKKCGC